MSDLDNEEVTTATSHTEPDDLQYVFHHAQLHETVFAARVYGLINKFGSMISWFWVALMLIICLNVFMKNVLGQGSVRFEEIQWHIYAALFLLGLSYSLVHDCHVRVDLLYERFNLRGKAWVDTVGIIVFLLPFLAVLFHYGEAFVVKAYLDGERSNSPAGLSHYWIIKSTLLIGFGLLAVAAIARLHICIAYLLGRSDWLAEDKEKQA